MLCRTSGSSAVASSRGEFRCQSIFSAGGIPGGGIPGGEFRGRASFRRGEFRGGGNSGGEFRGGIPGGNSGGFGIPGGGDFRGGIPGRDEFRGEFRCQSIFSAGGIPVSRGNSGVRARGNSGVRASFRGGNSGVSGGNSGVTGGIPVSRGEFRCHGGIPVSRGNSGVTGGIPVSEHLFAGREFRCQSIFSRGGRPRRRGSRTMPRRWEMTSTQSSAP